MDRHFDPTLKTLAELSPADWLPLVKRRRRRVTIEDSDVGTIVSGATDKLFRVHDDPQYLLHVCDIPTSSRTPNSRRCQGWKSLQSIGRLCSGAGSKGRGAWFC